MADVLTDKIVKTRKEHVCWGCGEKFEKGISLRFVKSIDSGVISSSYWCRICDVTALEHHDWNDDGFQFAVVKDLDGWFDNSRHLPRTY